VAREIVRSEVRLRLDDDARAPAVYERAPDQLARDGARVALEPRGWMTR